MIVCIILYYVTLTLICCFIRGVHCDLVGEYIYIYIFIYIYIYIYSDLLVNAVGNGICYPSKFIFDMETDNNDYDLLMSKCRVLKQH